MPTALSVEDRQLLRTGPKKAGNRVITAVDRAEIRIQACESHPDLILPDLMLPAGIGIP